MEHLEQVAAVRAPAAVRARLPCIVCKTRARVGSLTRRTSCIRAAADAGRAAHVKAGEARKRAAAETAPRRKKTCCTCGQVKSVAAFTRHGTAKDGRRRDCKVCVEARRRLHRR